MDDPPIRVLLVCGHPVIVGVVRMSCDATDRIKVVGEVGTGAAVRGAVETLAPEAIIVDLELPDGDGLAALPTITAAGSPVVAVSERSDGPTVLAALRAGVSGFLVKPEGLRDVGRAVTRVVAGDRVLDPALGGDLVRELGRFVRQTREGVRVASAVTPREREILGLLAEGMTMRQVGRRLGISHRTVESHVAALYHKLDVHSRVQAVAKGAALGLIELR